MRTARGTCAALAIPTLQAPLRLPDALGRSPGPGFKAKSASSARRVWASSYQLNSKKVLP
jgi:hypothetical protein